MRATFDMPEAKQTRWVPKQKQQVLCCLLAGQLDLDEAKTTYTLSTDELISWYGEYREQVLSAVLPNSAESATKH